MSEQSPKTLDVRTRAQWRKWLQKHHRSASEIWLVFHKQHTGKKSVAYDASVDEALCFGWVDSLIRRLDDDRSIRVLPAYLEKALKANPRAWQHFEQLAPSYRRSYIGWIDSAKKEQTKAKRLAEAIRLLAAGEKLGLK